MYLENKDGDIDGVVARIGWVTFTKSGKGIRYRERLLLRANGIKGNYIDEDTNEEYWVSGIKKIGSNTHWAESTRVEIDEDARAEYQKIRGGT